MNANTILDIETEPAGDDVLNEMMPSAIRNPQMPPELTTDEIPEFVNKAIKDEVKQAAWREEKISAHKKAIEAKREKWHRDTTNDKQAWIDDCALRAETSSIRMIGMLESLDLEKGEIIDRYLTHGGDELSGLDYVDNYVSEAQMLLAFWNIVRNSMRDNAQWIGWYSNKFDWPMLWRRSVLCGVPPVQIRSGRYVSKPFIDLHEEWQLGDNQTKLSLANAAKAFGIEGKRDNEGAGFHRLWRENKMAALQYCQNDLIITAQIARRMGFNIAKA